MRLQAVGTPDALDRADADIVRFEVDPANPPPLTDAQKAELAALAAKPDSEIDFGDIPPLTESFWRNAERGRFYKPVKQQITARVDDDVLAWLKLMLGPANSREPVLHPIGEQPPAVQQSHPRLAPPRLPHVFCSVATQTPNLRFSTRSRNHTDLRDRRSG